MEAHWEVTLGGQDFGIMVEKVLEWVGSWKKAPILQHIFHFFFESHVEHFMHVHLFQKEQFSFLYQVFP